MPRKTESVYDASWRELWQTWVASCLWDLLMLVLEVKWQVATVLTVSALFWLLGR